MAEPVQGRALWHNDPYRSETRILQLRSQGSHELLLHSKFSLISLGTELTVARGLMPQAMFDIMSVPYMDGTFSLPVKYGYSLVGQDPETGKNYYLLHPHQSKCVVRRDDVFEIPAEIPLKRAALASNLGTALSGVWDGDVKPGERVAIIGFGMIGSLVARIIQDIPGVDLRILEINPARIEFARKLGFKLWDSEVDDQPFDIAFHTSATETGLQTAIDTTGFEGRIIEMSWYGTRKVSLSLGGSFHIQRKKLISSQVSNIPGKMQKAWNRLRRTEAVFDLLRNPAYDLHLTNTVSLTEAADLFNLWRSMPPDGPGYVIQY